MAAEYNHDMSEKTILAEDTHSQLTDSMCDTMLVCLQEDGTVDMERLFEKFQQAWTSARDTHFVAEAFGDSEGIDIVIDPQREGEESYKLRDFLKEDAVPYVPDVDFTIPEP